MITFGVENETLVWSYQPPTTDATAPKFYISYGNYPFSNGPPGEPNYWNHVAYMGWNYVSGDRVDTSQAGYALAFESKFYQSNVFAHEFHLQGVGADGAARRWLTLFMPVSTGTSSGMDISVDNFKWNSGDGTNRMAAILGPTTLVTFPGSAQLQFGTNNTFVQSQKNAAGTSFIALPYIDNFDRVTVGGGLFVNAPTTDAEYGSALSTNVATLANNKSLVYGQNSNVATGTIYAFNYYNMNSSGKVIGGVGNNVANGHAILEARTETTGGDPMLSVQINGEAGYSVGIDNSDSNKFKISAGIQRLGNGTEDRIVIDGDTVAVVNRPFKLPSYTVAGLPSAATSGAGAMVYVSNASGGPTIACSDGTDWKVAAVLGAVVT